MLNLQEEEEEEDRGRGILGRALLTLTPTMVTIKGYLGN